MKLYKALRRRIDDHCDLPHPQLNPDDSYLVCRVSSQLIAFRTHLKSFLRVCLATLHPRHTSPIHFRTASLRTLSLPREHITFPDISHCAVCRQHARPNEFSSSCPSKRQFRFKFSGSDFQPATHAARSHITHIEIDTPHACTHYIHVCVVCVRLPVCANPCRPT